jgi:hypothetical protein
MSETMSTLLWTSVRNEPQFLIGEDVRASGFKYSRMLDMPSISQQLKCLSKLRSNASVLNEYD